MLDGSRIMALPFAFRWPVRPGEQATVAAVACELDVPHDTRSLPSVEMPRLPLVGLVYHRAGVVASWTCCAVMLWNFYDLYGGHYSRPLRRYWVMPYAPYAVLVANTVITAAALYGCRRRGLLPWVVMGTAKVHP